MIEYRIESLMPHEHVMQVSLKFDRPAADQRLSLPVWIPGSYLVREFARHLSGLSATQGGRTVALQQLDKATWSVRCVPGETLVVRYRIYAFDASVRAAFVDAQRGFFNGTSVFLRVEGAEAEPHRLTLCELPAEWQVATALPAVQVDARGIGDYQAASYDELVDHPVALGRFWRGNFEAGRVAHEYIVTGALPDFDGVRLLADAQRICAAQIAFWHGDAKPPFARYVFLHHLVDEGRGGLEHRASTALISPRRDMPALGKAETSEGYADLLGLISHEYFHTWNVKRLRPAEFETLDYTRENHTELLWFFEGFTSYYDDLFLVRTGLIDIARYLKLVARTIAGVLASPGRRVQSVAQSSFDTWVKYYRADENTPNATISYYTKGSLVALALDLTLRAEGRGTLDDVMRALWAASGGGAIDQAQIAAALQQIGGRSYAPELAAWVHGTDDLPLAPLLAAVGIEWADEPATLAQRLGLRISESALTGVRATHVLRGGAAERAGISAGDELLAVAGWRLRRLDDALRVLKPAVAAPLLVARDQRVLSLDLVLPAEAPAGAAAINLKVLEAAPAPAQALRKAWLAT